MGTQTGVTISGPNAPWAEVDNIPRPTPGPGEALVKSLAVGIHAVEAFCHSGVLVTEWPAVLGSDACGVVLETGEGCTKLKKGDYLYGCMLIAQNKYTPFQETYLVKEDLVFKKDVSTSVEEACTIGVGLLTAALCVLTGLDMELPPLGKAAEPKDSWVIIMGGNGSAGQFSCRLASLCGYKVLASCSPSKTGPAKAAGASATFDSRAPMEEQLAEIKQLTGGKFGRVFDSTLYATDLSLKALETLSAEPEKYFSSADDWSPMNIPDGYHVYRIRLGRLGRETDPDGKATSADVRARIPTLESWIEAGELKSQDYYLVPGMGWGSVIEGLGDLEGGKATKKIVVKVQEE